MVGGAILRRALYLFVGLAVLLASGNSFAENWVGTNPGDEILDYVDTSSIAVVRKDVIKARVKSVYPGDMILEDIAYNEIHAVEYYQCGKHQIAHKSIAFLKDGEFLYSAKKRASEIKFEAIIPGTPVERELTFVCQQAGKGDR